MVDYGIDNDAAGYVSPQGLRNVLIIQANHEAWAHFIRLRACNRNTTETQYVSMLILEELLRTEDGPEMFANIGPDCVFGKCREGSMGCGQPIVATSPREFIENKWPLLKDV
jgi:thymidylate synthase (FAD)